MAVTVRGTDGNNVIYQDDFGPYLYIYGYAGSDRIYLNLTGKNGGFNTVYAGDDNDLVRNYFEGGNLVDLGSGNDSYVATGFSTASNYYDKVYAGFGNDKFEVSTYHSEYYGEDGNDAFFSVGFRNYFNGGSGIDTISYESQDEDIDLSGRGISIDLERGLAATKGTSYKEYLSSIENAIGTGVADTIYGSSVANKLWGDGGNDVLSGKGGNDTVYGGSGNDKLYGDTGNDKLYGETGNDQLFGGTGNDQLFGGAGTDYLNGGTGADTFVFTTWSESAVGSKRDVIQDFYASEDDYIDLHAIDADTTFGGNQSFSFIGSKAFTGEAGELRFSGGIISGDVNGDGVADFQIAVTGVTKMYSGDFYL